MANPPAFASIGYTIQIGEKTAAEAIASMSQNLQTADTATAMQWKPPISDTTLLLPDGVTVRRMLTYATPGPLANGQFLYPSAATLDGCVRELFTAMLEAYCGAPVTALPPVLWDTPDVILGASLGSWWTAVAIGGALAGFANPWTSTGFGGLPGAPTAVAANPFVLGAADGRFNSATPVVSAGGPQFMATGPLVIAQPFSRMVIGGATAAASAGNWLSGVAAADSDMIRDAVNETFTTDAGANTLVGPPQDADAHMLGVDALGGALSQYWRDGQLFAVGAAGAGGSTGVTMLADNTGAAGFLPASVTDIVQSASGLAFTAAQWASLFAYAQGRYGIGYG